MASTESSNKVGRISVRVTPEDSDAFLAAATVLGLTRSEAIRAAVSDFVDRIIEPNDDERREAPATSPAGARSRGSD